MHYFYWEGNLIIKVLDEVFGECCSKCFTYDGEWFSEDCKIVSDKDGKILYIQTIAHMRRIGPTLVKELEMIERKEKLRKLLS